jgi:hypothetical protein
MEHSPLFQALLLLTLVGAEVQHEQVLLLHQAEAAVEVTVARQMGLMVIFILAAEAEAKHAQECQDSVEAPQ